MQVNDHKTDPIRIASIDVFRAVTMFFMIFVNDVGGVHQIPKWIDHVGADDDGMGFADTIFPAFLFIVGLSLPLAINNRIKKGDSLKELTFYILTRSFALVVMGLYHVNLEEYNPSAVLPKSVWMLLMTIAFFMIWMNYPRDFSKKLKNVLIVSGCLILLALAAMYKGGEGNDIHWMHTSWWGILGIIGWSYLICALIFLFTGGRLLALFICYAILASINCFSHLGYINASYLWVLGDASSATLTMGGMVLTVVYLQWVGKNQWQKVWLYFPAAAMAFFFAGWYIRPFAGGISKIHSTPAWVFICSGISILVFTLIAFLVDKKGKKDWFKIIKPAGTSTLTCYLIPYLMVGFFMLIHFQYPAFLNNGAGGIIRSFSISFITIWIAGWLERRKIRIGV
ncbi:DUF5009 domain-containing protein [Pedobacter sp. HMF7647]|uniref:DUF5009 domain-containing protein n=1 Tax=Hufsiella arboris TaxID=2695275 RepID=A0A7K1Y6H5_9SPHI|nr:DUF5009 domain-containing protein [Hufsiella arboris]MXV50163.1 DUF5009 domain-containing protein [Hufsiella arboris]